MILTEFLVVLYADHVRFHPRHPYIRVCRLSNSCIIDAQNLIKVADFGLAGEIYARNYLRQETASHKEGEALVKLQVKWMALESLHDGVFSEKTDVVSVVVCQDDILSMHQQLSFGVTSWEVFSLGKNPYPGVDPFSLIRYLESGERLDEPLNEACSQEM